jgi:hypothetical protein
MFLEWADLLITPDGEYSKPGQICTESTWDYFYGTTDLNDWQSSIERDQSKAEEYPEGVIANVGRFMDVYLHHIWSELIDETVQALGRDLVVAIEKTSNGEGGRTPCQVAEVHAQNVEMLLQADPTDPEDLMLRPLLLRPRNFKVIPSGPLAGLQFVEEEKTDD